MANIVLRINGDAHEILAHTLHLEDNLGERSDLVFQILDPDGSFQFEDGNHVTIVEQLEASLANAWLAGFGRYAASGGVGHFQTSNFGAYDPTGKVTSFRTDLQMGDGSLPDPDAPPGVADDPYLEGFGALGWLRAATAKFADGAKVSLRVDLKPSTAAGTGDRPIYLSDHRPYQFGANDGVTNTLTDYRTQWYSTVPPRTTVDTWKFRTQTNTSAPAGAFHRDNAVWADVLELRFNVSANEALPTDRSLELSEMTTGDTVDLDFGGGSTKVFTLTAPAYFFAGAAGDTYRMPGTIGSEVGADPAANTQTTVTLNHLGSGPAFTDSLADGLWPGDERRQLRLDFDPAAGIVNIYQRDVPGEIASDPITSDLGWTLRKQITDFSGPLVPDDADDLGFVIGAPARLLAGSLPAGSRVYHAARLVDDVLDAVMDPGDSAGWAGDTYTDQFAVNWFAEGGATWSRVVPVAPPATTQRIAFFAQWFPFELKTRVDREDFRATIRAGGASQTLDFTSGVFAPGDRLQIRLDVDDGAKEASVFTRAVPDPLAPPPIDGSEETGWSKIGVAQPYTGTLDVEVAQLSAGGNVRGVASDQLPLGSKVFGTARILDGALDAELDLRDSAGWTTDPEYVDQFGNQWRAPVGGVTREVVVETGTVFFEGFIAQLTAEAIQTTEADAYQVVHSIRVIDNHYRADKRLITKAYQNAKAGDIVRSLVTGDLGGDAVPFPLGEEGVTIGTIEDGLTIPLGVANHINVAQLLDRLAEASDFVWRIDHERRLHFHALDTVTGPVQPTRFDLLSGTVKAEASNPRYRNRQTVRGGTVETVLQTEGFQGTGEARLGRWEQIDDGGGTADPGSGNIARDAAFAAATQLRVSGTDADGTPFQIYLASLEEGGTFQITEENAASRTEVYRVTAPAVDFSTWVVIPVAPVAQDSPVRKNQSVLANVTSANPQRTFVVSYPLNRVPLIIRNGAAQTVGIRGVDDSAQWLWNKASPILTLNRSEPALGASDLVLVTYFGQRDSLIRAFDTAAENERKAREDSVNSGTTGIVEEVLVTAGYDELSEAIAFASAELVAFAKHGATIVFDTDLIGIQPGDRITVRLPAANADALAGSFHLGARAAVREEGLLERDYTVRTVEVFDLDGLRMRRRVHGLDNQALKTWRGFWQRRLEPDRDTENILLNVDEDEVAIVTADVFEAWDWSELVTPTINACPVPAVSLVPEGSLLPC